MPKLSPMTSHIPFDTTVEREEPRTPGPALRMPSSSPGRGTSNAYWDTGAFPFPASFPRDSRSTTESPNARDYPYSQYRTEIPSPPLDTPASSHPSIDFSGLIPMYGEPGSPNVESRGRLPGLSYEHEWSNAPFQRNKSTPWHHSFEGQLPYPHPQWNSAIDGGMSQGQHFNVPYSPPPSYSSATLSPASSSYVLPPQSKSKPPRRGNADHEPPKKSCFHCHVTSTPLWRRDPSTQKPLCNACGLYLQQRNKLRPQALIDADIDDDDAAPEIPDAEYTGPKCSHCLTRRTSVWRRSKSGAQVCNACGVYARLRGKERPLSLRRNKIKPRTKHSR